MRTFIGIDLGSTTTKAVVLDESMEVLGRGITNSRSNYDTASRVAKYEALINTRLTLFRRGLERLPALSDRLAEFLGSLERAFRLEQFLEQLSDLEATCRVNLTSQRFKDKADALGAALGEVFARLRDEAPALFAPGAKRKSDFFRDVAGSRFMAVAEAVAKDSGLAYDVLLNLYDKSIIDVENRPPAEEMRGKFLRALDRMIAAAPDLAAMGAEVAVQVREALEVPLEETYVVGTGYGG
jgi:benzoyl-CoA reductase subunit A